MQRMIFFSGGWMPSYNGIDNETIVNGGRYVDENKFGGEVYNFRNSQGKNYGFVQSKGFTINLTKINFGQAYEGNMIENVTCVFVATHPKGGRRIVGWYRNARIYTSYQTYHGNDRKILKRLQDWPKDSDQVGYYAVAKNSDVVLLPEDERLDTPEIPTGKGGFGQSNVWYADSDIGMTFKSEVAEFISGYERKESKEKIAEQERHARSKVDLEAKKKVEDTAINCTCKYYEDLGYFCKHVGKENRGWDLEFKKGNVKLRVEVKGLSQSYISVVLSRNEYEKMRANLDSYRLSVVTNCLDKSQKPTINIFQHVSDKAGWFDQYGQELIIEEIVAARCGVIDTTE